MKSGPLVFALKYEPSWKAYPGTPITPLPEGWSWFQTVCAEQPALYALPKSAKEGKLDIQKKTVPTEAYPWEESPLRLQVSMVPAQNHVFQARMDTYRNNLLMYGNPVTPDEGKGVKVVELVPFGSTNLRLTCFPICK